MSTWYFKRFLMEFPLDRRKGAWPELPPGYQFLSWDPVLMDLHAEAKFRAFRDEVDAHVFTCFHDLDGCRRLMHEIARKRGFLPEADRNVLAPRRGPQAGLVAVQALQEAHGLVEAEAVRLLLQV